MFRRSLPYYHWDRLVRLGCGAYCQWTTWASQAGGRPSGIIDQVLGGLSSRSFGQIVRLTGNNMQRFS